MKSYEFVNSYRFRPYTQSVDLLTALSSHPWKIYAEGDEERELITFLPDHVVTCSSNGVVEHYSWQYFKSSDTVLITISDDLCFFLKAVYISDDILMLNLDGVPDDCIFMYDPSSVRTSSLHSLDDIRDLLFDQLQLRVQNRDENMRRVYAKVLKVYSQSKEYAVSHRWARWLRISVYFQCIWIVLATIVTILIMSYVLRAMQLDLRELIVLLSVSVLLVYVPLFVWIFHGHKRVKKNTIKSITFWVGQQYTGMIEPQSQMVIDPVILLEAMKRRSPITYFS